MSGAITGDTEGIRAAPRRTVQLRANRLFQLHTIARVKSNISLAVFPAWSDELSRPQQAARRNSKWQRSQSILKTT
jgi:hypothetical protein